MGFDSIDEIEKSKKEESKIVTKNSELYLREKFVDNYEKYADDKLNKYLGREDDIKYDEEDGYIVFSHEDTYYNHKIDELKNLAEDDKAKSVASAKVRNDKSAKKRASNMKEATEHFQKARKAYYTLANERRRLDNATTNRSKIQKNIYDLEDELLRQRRDAALIGAKVKAKDADDEEFRKDKIKLTYIACKLKLLKERNKEYTKEYNELLEEYEKKCNVFIKKKMEGKEENKKDIDFTKNDTLAFREYLRNVVLSLSTNKLIYCVGKFCDKKKVPANERASYKYLTGEGRAFVTEDVLRIRLIMILEAMKNKADVHTLETLAKDNKTAPEWRGEVKDEKAYNSYLMQTKDWHSEYEYMRAMQYSLVDRVVERNKKKIKLKESGGFTNYMPRDFAANLPLQGFKMHIGARNLRDFYEIGRVLIPDLVRLNIPFKIAELNNYYRSCNADYCKTEDSNLIGKEFTIYANENFNIDLLSEESKAVLSKEVTRKAGTDKLLAGSRLTARFAAFSGDNFIDENGILQEDVRKDGGIQAKKDILAKKESFYGQLDAARTVTAFYSDIKSEYEQTGDFERYVNQYMLGKRFDKNAKLPLMVKDQTKNLGLVLGRVSGLGSSAFRTKDGSMMVHAKDPTKVKYQSYGITDFEHEGKSFLVYPAIYEKEMSIILNNLYEGDSYIVKMINAALNPPQSNNE